VAANGRIPVRHEDVFPEPTMLLSVDPVEDFDRKRAGDGDPQERDKETGQRLWAVSVIDPSAQAGRREVKVKMAADHQPVPPHGVGQPVEFDGLVVIPYLDTNRAKPRVGIAYRAAGFRGVKSMSKAS
jgi:hypothetical protein